jgi:hypothetical protein
VNAVEEKKIRKGTDLRWLIETDIIKRCNAKDSDNYKNAKKYLDKALERKPDRVHVEYGQRKGNCTTRGQRIMMADIVNDAPLADNFYNFTCNIEGSNAGDIHRSLERNIGFLENIRQALDAGAGRSALQVDTAIKAFDKDNYELQFVPAEAGGAKLPVWRTKPGVFSAEELQTLQVTLYRNGVNSARRESIASPGNHYLYVPPMAASQIERALQQDDSPAAQLYRKYGRDAVNHVYDLLPEGQKPMQVIGNRARWQKAEANDDTPLIRTALAGMTEPAIQALETVLRNQGFHPIRHVSASMGGPTLRLEGADAAKFEAWQDSISPKPKPVAPKAPFPNTLKIWQ